VKIGSSSSSWQYFDEVITVSSAFFSIMCYNLSGVTHSAEFDNILIQEVGKTYLDVFHKSDWGITANETAITSGLIENTIYEVLTGSFKVVMDTYNGHDVKVIECVSTGTIQLPALVGGTVWGCYTDTGSGYVYEEGPASITADVLSMTAGDKIILGDIRGDYAIRRI
jgi:hypothetical protein